MQLSAIHEASRRDLFRKLRPASQAGAEPESQVAGSDSDITRRELMRRAGGLAATSLARTNPAFNAASKVLGMGRMAGAAAQGLFDDVPDEELLETPEEEWLSKISPARAAAIARKYPEHGTNEAVSKLVKILVYGYAKSRGADPGSAKATANTAERASKALMDIGKNWRLKQSDIMAHASKWGITDDPEQAVALTNFLRQNANHYGIKLDVPTKPAKKSAQPAAQPTRHSSPVEQDHDLHRWADDGGANYFESRLRRALSLV